MIRDAIDLGEERPRARDEVELAGALRPVLIRLARELRHETEQLGVTPRQAALLSLVRLRPGVSLRELAAEERISAPALSGHIDRLERLSLVERVRSADDRRRVGLVLTPEGARLLRRVKARRTTWLAERLREVSLDDAEAIAGAIAPLWRLLGEEPH